MKNKKDFKVIIGIAIVAVVVILTILGYKEFGSSVAVPQVDKNTIVETNINVLPTGSSLLGKNNTNEMEPIQVIKRDSGLVIEIMQEGSGEQVKSGDTVSVDYRGFLTDGTIFDESYKRGQQFSFIPGAGQVIAGWEEGVLGMRVGEKRRLSIPSNLAYGAGGVPGVIPGGATLIFDIELHKIN